MPRLLQFGRIRIELDVQRGRLGQRLPGRQAARRPGPARRAGVVGQHVVGPVALLNGLDPQFAKQLGLIPQGAVQPFRAERQIRRQQELQVIDGLKRGVHRPGGGGFVGLDDREPGRVIEVGVYQARQGQRPLQPGAQMNGVNLGADGLKSGFDLRQQLAIPRLQLPRIRDLPIPVAIGERGHPIGQVAPGGHQFVVVAADEIRPCKVAVARLGQDRGHIESDGVRIVALQDVRQPDRPIAALAELGAVDVHELVGRDVVGQVEGAVLGAS